MDCLENLPNVALICLLKHMNHDAKLNLRQTSQRLVYQDLTNNCMFFVFFFIKKRDKSFLHTQHEFLPSIIINCIRQTKSESKIYILTPFVVIEVIYQFISL